MATPTATGQHPRKLFFGWWIVILSVLLMAVLFGTIINSFSLFITPVIEDLEGISIRQFALAYSVLTLCALPLSPVVGNLLKKFDARWIISFGIIVAVLANVVMASAQNLFTIYAGAVLQGVAVVFATTIPISTMITNWFIDLRGTALGIATAGSGLGSIIFVPLIKFTLLPEVGWRGTYLTIGAILLVMLPLFVLVARSTPEQKGLKPLGWENQPTAAEGVVVERPGLTQRQVYTSPAFWLLGLALIFSGISVNGMISNLDPILGHLQSPTNVAAFILASIGLFVMAGKFIAGVLFDKISVKTAIVIISLANAAQFFFMLSPTTILGGAAFGILHGFGATMVTVTPAYLASKLFGEKDYCAVYGSVMVFVFAGAGMAPLFGALFYGSETTSNNGGATTLVWAWLIMGLIGMGLFLVTVMKRPAWESESSPGVRSEASA